MNMLQVNTTVNTGSTGRIAEGIGRQLMKSGHQSTIAYGRSANASASETMRIGNKWDQRWHGLMTRLRDRHGLASKRATKSFLSKWIHHPPDVIGLHNIHGYYLHYPALFSFIKQHHIPVIWTFHDCWPFTGHCTYFDRVECKKWQSHCHNCPMTGYYPTSWGRDRSYKNFIDKRTSFTGVANLTIVTPSHWLQKLVKQSFLQEYPVKVIHNGIDLEVFQPVRLGNNDKLILGVANPWSERKGLSDFLSLRQMLPKEYRMVLIGLSQKQRQQLPEGIEGILKTESVEELAEWYSRATVFVNPTHVDNFPTVNLEALGCGTPVVTYNTGGSPEAVDANTGRVVDKGDIKGLATAINELAVKDQQSLKNACRQRAEKYFNQEERYKEYVQLYEEIAESAHP